MERAALPADAVRIVVRMLRCPARAGSQRKYVSSARRLTCPRVVSANPSIANIRQASATARRPLA
jgi:hypothetical protein